MQIINVITEGGSIASTLLAHYVCIQRIAHHDIQLHVM